MTQPGTLLFVISYILGTIANKCSPHRVLSLLPRQSNGKFGRASEARMGHALQPHPSEDTISQLAQMENGIGQGLSAIDGIGMTQLTCYRLRREYGGLELDETRV